MSAVRIGGRVTARALLAAASAALCLGGIAMVVRGAMVPVEARVAQVELGRAFDRELAENMVKPEAAPVQSATKAVPPAQVQVPAPALLAPAAGLPAAARPAAAAPIAPGKPLARITVARLGVRDVVLAGPASHDLLAKGPMMVKRGDDASPVTVLAAHRDTHFLFVRDLRAGDIVTLQYVTGEVERYRVGWFETVRWDAFAYPLDPRRPLLALTTCYPFGGTEYGSLWRRVAWAERVG